MSRAQRALEEAWEATLDDEARAALHHGSVDLDADEATCPACGATFDPKDLRCSDCGLNLGAA